MKTALVTGASTGIGRATALWLDARGWRVYAGVRREEDCDSLAEAGSDRLQPVLLDVTDQEQIEAAAVRVAEDTDGAGLDGLVNNAGIAVPGPLETLPIEDFRRQLDVNLTAQVAVTKAMLPSIRAARGRIVFNTSIGGLMALPMFGAYHACQVRPRGGRRFAPPGAASVGHLGLDHRAGLDSDPDLGARGRRGGRDHRARHRGGEGALPALHRRSSEGG